MAFFLLRSDFSGWIFSPCSLAISPNIAVNGSIEERILWYPTGLVLFTWSEPAALVRARLLGFHRCLVRNLLYHSSVKKIPAGCPGTAERPWRRCWQSEVSICSILSTGVLCSKAFASLPGLPAGWEPRRAASNSSLSRRILRNCHDDASRFTSLLAKPGCDCLQQEDFIPLLQVLPHLAGTWHRAVGLAPSLFPWH